MILNMQHWLLSIPKDWLEEGGDQAGEEGLQGDPNNLKDQEELIDPNTTGDTGEILNLEVEGEAQRLTESTGKLISQDEQIEDRELKQDLERDASRYTKEFQGSFYIIIIGGIPSFGSFDIY